MISSRVIWIGNIAILILLTLRSVELRPDNIKTIVLTGEVNVTYKRQVNESVEYVYQFLFNSTNFNGDDHNGDIRVHVDTEHDTGLDFPVIFVVRQQKSVVSWQLPVRSVIEPKKKFFEASRTLCSDFKGSKLNEMERMVFVSISTSSPHNASFSLTVNIENNFLMKLGEKYSSEVSPPSPRFYKFVFNSTNSKFVLLEVTSADTICMTVSVQNVSCPVFDQESNVQFEGYWQTMSTKAGMTIRRDDFPLGFYIVFVVHSDDSTCSKDNEDRIEVEFEALNRLKNVNFTIHDKITDIQYITAIFGTIGIFLVFYFISFLASCIYLFKPSNALCPIEDIMDQQDHDNNMSSHIYDTTDVENNAFIESNNSLVQSQECTVSTIDPGAPIASSSRVVKRIITSEPSNGSPDHNHWLADCDSSIDETDYDTLEDANTDKDIFRMNPSLCVAALARKNPSVLAKKSQLYLWTLLTVAIFYALPVVQLVFTYQKVLHTTGNQDLCYYNYLCSHPLWLLSDFNHVYSNIGYIMLGFLFILLTYRKVRMHQTLSTRHITIDTHYGIPRHFGLFYAMGFALIMEGVLSACYHVCPNHSNFQFDTCFMYVNSILCMLKIYQTRHPDINASAYMAFGTLAFVVLIGVIGVLAGNLYFWIVFTFLHVGCCLFLSIQIYYLGRWRLDIGVFRRLYLIWRNDCLANPLLCMRPYYLDRMILLILANLANWGIAFWGVWRMSHDFASHLLLIFMSNLLLYTLFYIIMKLTHGEKILCQPLIYIVLSCILWGLSFFVFLHKSTSWQLSPSQSRSFNRECLVLSFYDTHDIWHFLSASSMFFSFMILLTLDDDLIYTPRTKITVF